MSPPGAPAARAKPVEARPPVRRRGFNRAAHGERQEAATGAETWLISYTDMVTLLLTVFVLLVSFTGLQPRRVPAETRDGQPEAAQPVSGLPIFDGGNGLLPERIIESPGPPEALPEPPPAPPAGASAVPAEAPVAGVAEPPRPEGATVPPGSTIVPNELAWLRDRARELEQLAVRPELERNMSVQRTETALLVQLRDGILFAPGRAELTVAGESVIARLAAVLRGLPGEVDVEGHTDARPITNARFASNWELSAARAARVARELAQNGMPADKLRAIGYADSKPVASNDTPEGRAANRRVALTILARAPLPPAVGSPLPAATGKAVP